MGGGGIGIGAEVSLSGLTGAEFVYDVAMFHVEAILGYDHISNANNGGSSSDFTFGVGGWYHLARGTNADFSIGGSVGLFYNSPLAGAGNSSTHSHSSRARRRGSSSRPNFALNARVGCRHHDLATATSRRRISIAGQETAGLGFTYFFR